MDFEELYKLYFKDVYLFVLAMSQDAGTAEEITQETFYKALKNIGKFQENCSVKTWLCQIAKNTYLTYLKKQKRLTPEDNIRGSDFPYVPGTHTDTNAGNAEAIYICKEETISIYKVLHHLEEPFKEVFTLRTLGDLSFKEIGEIFDRKEGWARVTYFRAKQKIQELIGFLILVLLGGDYIYTTHFKDYVHSVPTSDVKVTELYQLNNGDIYCTLKTKEPFYMIRSDSIQIPENKVWQDYDQGWHEVQFQYPGFFTDDLDIAHYSRDHMTFVFPMEEDGTSPWGDQKPYHYTAASVKCIGKSKNDVLTIWKKGQKISQAPMEIEEKVITEYVNCGELGKAFEQCKQLGISLEDLDIKDDILETAYDNYYNIGGREAAHDESFTYCIYDEEE